MLMAPAGKGEKNTTNEYLESTDGKTEVVDINLQQSIKKITFKSGYYFIV